MSSTWPTLDQIKARHGITDTAHDDILTALLALAIEQVERYTNRAVIYGPHTETFRGSRCERRGELFLKAQPVESITSISGSDNWELTSYGSICFYTGCSERTPLGDITVTYMGGLPEIPAAMIEVVYAITGAGYKASDAGVSIMGTGAIKKETVYGVAAVEYAVSASDESPIHAKYYATLLDSYRMNIA